MSTLRKTFATSKDVETTGFRFVFDTDETGKEIAFIIARAGGGNSNYRKSMQRISAPHMKAAQAKALPEEKANAILVEAFCESVLLGWENVTEGDLAEFAEDETANQRPLVFNKKNAIRLMTELPDLFTTLYDQANELQNFRIANLELAAKN